MTAPTTDDRRSRRPSRIRRACVVVCMALALAWGSPAVARADDFWGLWVREIPERPWWEMPFATIISFPAMVITTPFWAGMKLPGLFSGGDDDDGGDDDY